MSFFVSFIGSFTEVLIGVLQFLKGISGINKYAMYM